MLRTEVGQSSIISIHALRGEGDGNSGGADLANLISIHALRGEGDIRPYKVIALR